MESMSTNTTKGIWIVTDTTVEVEEGKAGLILGQTMVCHSGTIEHLASDRILLRRS